MNDNIMERKDKMKTKIRKITTLVLIFAMMLSLLPVYEQVMAASKPGKPKITVKISDDGASAVISIGKTKMAQGYQIAAKLPGAKKFALIKTLESDGTKKRRFKLENVPDGQYFVKVRAYSEDNGNNVYGKYSKVKEIVIANKNFDLGLTQGDIIQFGSFEQDGNLENGAEPIDWIVLSNEDGKLFLTSVYVLAPGNINDGPGVLKDDDNDDENSFQTWNESGMRKWLNGEFLTGSFSKDEAAVIADTELTDVGTTDKIFLLSKDDVKNKEYGFSDKKYRACVPTLFAQWYEETEGDGMDGVWTWDDGKVFSVNDKAACYWWLRTAGSGSGVYYIVNEDGSFGTAYGFGSDYDTGHYDYDEEIYIENGGFGIRPALVVNVTSDVKNLITKTENTMQKEWSTADWKYYDEDEEEFEDGDETENNEQEEYTETEARTIMLPEGEVKKLSKAKKGDCIIYGSYEQDNNLENGKEPIKWKVLYKKNNELLVVSMYGLDAKPYNEAWKDNDMSWEKCSLRKWLNEDFYKEAFSKTEKKKIKTATVDNLIDGESGDKVNSTNDKVFLLSKKDLSDASLGFDDKLNLVCPATKYAIARGAVTLSYYDTSEDDFFGETEEYFEYCFATKDTEPAEVASWWLRTMDKTQYDAYFIDLDYNAISTFANYSDATITVRPAMIIKLK